MKKQWRFFINIEIIQYHELIANGMKNALQVNNLQSAIFLSCEPAGTKFELFGGGFEEVSYFTFSLISLQVQNAQKIGNFWLNQ